MTWKIQAVTGDLAGQEISIERDMLVGRHQSADIVLQQAEISRKHAAFLLKEQALWVQDLNSSNGTFVNDARLENAEALLQDGDIVQFAGLKFAVLQPAEAAAAEAQPEAASAAQKMNDQGMPELAERDAGIQLSRDGIPQHVAVPKPAPIPEGVDLSAAQPEPAPAAEQPAARAEQETEQRKNASVGLMTVAAIVILAILAWLFLK